MYRFVHALLMVEGRYVLQLRDDKPGIAAPGFWSLFGGNVEEGEDARAAIVREVEEELCVRLSDYRLFWTVQRYSSYAKAMASYSFFEADISHLWGHHRLREGQAAAHFVYSDLPSLKIPSFIRQTLARHHAETR